MSDAMRTREGGVWRAALASLIVVFVSASAGCRDTDAAVPLSGALPSSEALAQAVVDAFAARDAARLQALAISETEFKTHIWPSLPASRPGVGMPVDYVWTDTATRSRGYMAQTMATYGGRRSAVEAVRFGRPPVNYAGFRVHPDARLSLCDEAGRISEHRLFGSMVETDAGWKVYSYIVD